MLEQVYNMQLAVLAKAINMWVVAITVCPVVCGG